MFGELVVADGPADRLGEDDGGVGADLDGGAFALFSRCSRPVIRDPISTSPPCPSAMVANAACRVGDPSTPESHNHAQCRVSTGRRIAEALWNILSEVQGRGPVPSERINASLVDLHRTFREESALRRSLGQH